MANQKNNPKRELRSGDILTTGEFVERAKQKIDFDRGANVTVDVDEVPAHLRHLIPLVEKWALAGSGPQDVFVEHCRQHSPKELEAFVNAVRPVVDDIRSWIRESIDAVGVRNVPAAVSHFSYTMSTYELAKPADPDLLARGQQKVAALKAAKALERALEDAGDAMREKRYEDVVRLLGPHEAELTGANLKKLELARKRAAT